MKNTQKKLIHSQIWDLLSDYADIRDELESTSLNIRFLYQELGASLIGIGEELAHIEAHIASVSGSLKRFRCFDSPDVSEPDQKTISEELPWN